jgi:flagellar biosynthesis GTPase FlhF
MKREYAYIKYVGGKALKYDTVNRSRYKWTPGEIVPVEEKEIADRLLKFPTVWVEVEEEDYRKQEDSIAHAEAEVKKFAEDEEAKRKAEEEEAETKAAKEQAETEEAAKKPAGKEPEETDDPAIVAEIMKMNAEGMKPGEIGKALGLHHAKVQAIINRNTK